MKKTAIAIIIMAILMSTSCSMFISTPRVASIKIHGMNNQLDEYLVVLDPDYNDHMFDIQITDRYALYLDFQWLIDATIGNEQTVLDGQPTDDIAVTPWMMCTFKF